jgi:hypothetical protein
MVIAVVMVTTVVALALRRTRWAVLSLRVSRWTYGVLFPLSLLYFPRKSGFRFQPLDCEWTFGPQLAAHSLTNYAHIVMFAIFFLLTYAQLPRVRRALLWSAAATAVMGLLVELAQGATGAGHCRMRDLIPDMTGALIGVALVTVARRIWKPALVLLLVGCSDGRPMNFAMVDAGMYRGGQPSATEVAVLRRDLGIKTIIRLNRGSAVEDRTAARLAGIHLVEIPIDPKKLGTPDGPTREAVERAYAAFVDPSNAPVYLHCDRGRDRAGFIVGLYRARKQRWPYERIRSEMARYGHGTIMQRYLPAITAELAREASRPEGPPRARPSSLP